MSERDKFERWISGGPYEKPVDRFPDLDDKESWPGQYRALDVQLAWEAWQTARASEGGDPVAFAVYWGDGNVEFYESPLPAFGDEPEAVTPLYTHPHNGEQGEWKSVSDDLPALGVKVLTYSKDLGVLPQSRKKAQVLGNHRANYEWTAPGPFSNFTHRVTHWMPLPAPPTEMGGNK